jgi:DNA-binding transcriptional MerR regulator
MPAVEQAMVEKAPEAFRTISEVADELDLPQHVLRFWETRFTQIRPLKRGGGRRYYRPDDVDLLRGIRHLLYGEGYTIRGVQRLLKDNGPKFVQSVWTAGAPQPPPQARHAEDREAFQDELALEDAAERAGSATTGSNEHTALSQADMQRLRAALSELTECRRLLDQAVEESS